MEESPEDDLVGFYQPRLSVKPLTDFDPDMQAAVEDVRGMLNVAKNTLVGLRLRNVDANNIITVTEIFYKRFDQIKRESEQ